MNNIQIKCSEQMLVVCGQLEHEMVNIQVVLPYSPALPGHVLLFDHHISVWEDF